MDHMPPRLDARLRAIEFLIVNLYGIENRRRAWDADRCRNMVSSSRAARTIPQ